MPHAQSVRGGALLWAARDSAALELGREGRGRRVRDARARARDVRALRARWAISECRVCLVSDLLPQVPVWMRAAEGREIWITGRAFARCAGRRARGVGNSSFEAPVPKPALGAVHRG